MNESAMLPTLKESIESMRLTVVCYNRRRFEVSNKHQELQKQLFGSAK